MPSVRRFPAPSIRPAAPSRQTPQASGSTGKKVVDGFERKSVTAQLLQRGMTGPAVTQLQQRLVSAKFMSLDDLKSGPGVYGPRTEAAVKRLQAHVGLPVTGIAAPSTLVALAGGARYQPVREPQTTRSVRTPLLETFTDEVTQPMGHR